MKTIRTLLSGVVAAAWLLLLAVQADAAMQLAWAEMDTTKPKTTQQRIQEIKQEAKEEKKETKKEIKEGKQQMKQDLKAVGSKQEKKEIKENWQQKKADIKVGKTSAASSASAAPAAGSGTAAPAAATAAAPAAASTAAKLTAKTYPASGASYQARLNGYVSYPGKTGRVWFEFGENESLGRSTTAETFTGEKSVSQPLTGSWYTGRKYYYRIVAESSGQLIRGEIMTFTP